MPRVIRLVCTPTERCTFHEDGGPTYEKCPGTCAGEDCCCDGVYEIDDEIYCATCAAKKVN